MDIYDLFSKFELELLPNDWVQGLWKDDFSEAVEFPPDYEMYLGNADIGELMTAASTFIREWVENADSMNNTLASNSASSSHSRPSLNATTAESTSWQNLISNNVQHKALVSLISIFILKGKSEKQFEVKKLGLIATELYLLLLAIPGSQVFHIFNPILYSHAIENLKICSMLNSTSLTSKKHKKHKGSKRKEADDDDVEEDGDNDSDGEMEMSHSEKSTVIKMLNSVLSKLDFLLKRFNLKGQEDSLIITIQILILITRLERSNSSLLQHSPAHNSVSYLSFKAYKLLQALCSSDHGGVQETVSLIMREMISGFLIWDQKATNVSTREAVVIKDHSIEFIRNLLRVLQDMAFIGTRTLLQHICVRIPERAEARAKGCQMVLELLNAFPYNLYSHCVTWIMELCHNDQIKNRTTALDIVTRLLQGNERTPTSPLRPIPNGRRSDKENDVRNSDEEDEDNGIQLTQLPNFSTNKFLLATIFSKCQDSASSVRAKALSILANLISSNRSIRCEMESIFVTPYLNDESIESSNMYEKGFFDFHYFVKNMKKETNSNVDPLPGAKAIISLIELYIYDEKVFVRKSALQVLANIFLLNEKWMSKKLLEVMVDNCRDMSVSVRKLLVQCLTDLLIHYPNNPLLPHYWVLGVLPLLADQETKSQEKVLEALQTIVLDNLVAYNQMKTALHALPWTLIALIADQNKRKLFLFACHKWSLNNAFKQNMINIIKTHINTENNGAAWFLLSSYSEYKDIKDPEFVLEYFYENVLNTQQVDEYCCQLVTEVVHLSWRQLPTLNQVNLCDCLLRHLAHFTVPLPMISRCIDICQLITETHAESPEQARERVKEWSGNLISICESRLDKLIGVESPLVVEDEVRLCQYIYTVGDAALICPAQLKHSVLILIQNLLEGDEEEEDETDERRWKGRVNATTQAVAVVTLGKLCLQKEHMAKVLVPLFARLLSETPHAEIKVNAMIALTDLCIKFTSLVEKHLSEMCICLRDKDLQVRENTLALIIQLIQEDYLKLRCPMMFHLLTMLNDEHQLIRDMTSSFFVNSVLAKQQTIFLSHFVESLFHYNAYLGHETFSKSCLMDPRERAVFRLDGAERKEQRRHIYRFMMEHLTDPCRFQITYTLCTEILARVASEKMELTANCMTLLQDALHVLSSEEIRLTQMRQKSGDEVDEDEAEVDENAVKKHLSNMAKKKIISYYVKKNMIEFLVPVFIQLKQMLKKLKSPLVRDVMTCLRELMKDYKTEINEILAADKELAAEIEHDLHSREEDEEEEEEAQEQPNEEVMKRVIEAVQNMSKQETPGRNRSKRLSTSPSGSSVKSSQLSPVVNPSNSPAATYQSSPGSSKSSPGQVPPDSKQSSPSNSSIKSDVSLTLAQGETGSGLPVEDHSPAITKPKPRKSRSSTSSSCSAASTHSQGERKGRKKKTN